MPIEDEKKQPLSPAKQFAKNFQTNVNVFIQEKERLNLKNAKVGGRSIHEATGHAYFSLKAPVRAFGAKLKNPDHQDALKQREILLAYAHYLNWLAYEIGKSDHSEEKLNTFYKELKVIKKHLKVYKYKSDKFIGDETHPDSNLYGAEQKLTQLKNKGSLALELAPISKAEMDFIVLWPQLLNLENMSECFLSDISYQASDVYAWAGEHDIDIATKCQSFDGLRDLYQQYTNANKRNMLHIYSEVDSTNLHNEAKAEAKQGAKVKALNEMKDILTPMPIKLIGVVKLSDKAMEMDIEQDKYQNYRIGSFNDDNQPLNGGDNAHFDQNQPLADGWYQYVIVADKDKNGTPQKYDQDFRYYPCAKIKPEDMKKKTHAPYGKYIAHSQISGGLPIYAGGAFRVQNGVIDKIDNSSGHYPTNEGNMNYAGKRLGQLGMKEDSKLIVKILPPLTGEHKKKRNKTKAKSTLDAIASVRGNNLAQRAENRPTPPLSIQEKGNDPYDRTQRLAGYLKDDIYTLSRHANPAQVGGSHFSPAPNNNNNNSNNNNNNIAPSSPKRQG